MCAWQPGGHRCARVRQGWVPEARVSQQAPCWRLCARSAASCACIPPACPGCGAGPGRTPPCGPTPARPAATPEAVRQAAAGARSVRQCKAPARACWRSTRRQCGRHVYRQLPADGRRWVCTVCFRLGMEGRVGGPALPAHQGHAEGQGHPALPYQADCQAHVHAAPPGFWAAPACRWSFLTAEPVLPPQQRSMLAPCAAALSLPANVLLVKLTSE